VNQNCKITVVIAVLNARTTLGNCLDSVLEQDYPDKKLIVVDGGSTDGTLEIIHDYEGVLDWWISEPDQGIYDAWNKALPRIKDGWVLFLGADDVLRSSDVLTRAARKLILAEKGTLVAYGQVVIVDEMGRNLAIKGQPWELVGKNFTSTMTLPHQAVFHHCSLFEVFGNFNPQLKIAGDYDLLLRVIPKHTPMFLGNLVVASWTIGGISYNVKTPLLVAREFSMVRHINGYHSFSLPLATFYLKAYVLRGLCLLFGHRFAAWFAEIYRKLTKQWT
jgi:glycosyltransferase involved in cell wall biosynthesis